MLSHSSTRRTYRRFCTGRNTTSAESRQLALLTRTRKRRQRCGNVRPVLGNSACLPTTLCRHSVRSGSTVKRHVHDQRCGAWPSICRAATRIVHPVATCIRNTSRGFAKAVGRRAAWQVVVRYIVWPAHVRQPGAHAVPGRDARRRVTTLAV